MNSAPMLRNIAVFGGLSLAFACAGAQVAGSQPNASAAGNGGVGASRVLGEVPGQPNMRHGAAIPELKELPGVTSWKLLAKAKTTKKNKRFVTEYPPEILALNAKTIKLQGFMMPLGPADTQTHFLLTVTSQTCLFCIPAGPEGMVEIKTRKPVKVSFDPIIVSGRFESLTDDKNGLLYRLTDASLSQ